jgi:putative transposase
VVRVLNLIVHERGKPQTIKTDSGSEFIGKVMDKWVYEHGIELDFSRPEKPTDNAMVESFNGRLRQECLNEHWFMSLADAQDKIKAWRQFYNEVRPRGALDWVTPNEFAWRSGFKPRAPSITSRKS